MLFQMTQQLFVAIPIERVTSLATGCDVDDQFEMLLAVRPQYKHPRRARCCFSSGDAVHRVKELAGRVVEEHDVDTKMACYGDDHQLVRPSPRIVELLLDRVERRDFLWRRAFFLLVQLLSLFLVCLHASVVGLFLHHLVEPLAHFFCNVVLLLLVHCVVLGFKDRIGDAGEEAAPVAGLLQRPKRLRKDPVSTRLESTWLLHLQPIFFLIS